MMNEEQLALVSRGRTVCQLRFIRVYVAVNRVAVD